MAKAAHHRGAHQTIARRITTAANANPSTTCWRCGKTLAQHRPHKTGRAVTWQAGHIVDGNSSAGYAAEASTCNTSAGATAGNAQRSREPHSRHW